jgi:hypothetical protein
MDTKTLHRAQILYDRGSREGILELLQWNDPNGVYTDAISREEGYDPLEYDEALLILEELICAVENELREPAILSPL